MSKILQANISNTELLEMYGYEPCFDKHSGFRSSIDERWYVVAESWTVSRAEELGRLRQAMLQIHLDTNPDDERWR